MALETDGIATEQETYNKLLLSSLPSGYSPDRLITKTRVNTFGGDVDEYTNTYANNLCVRYSDILVKEDWNMHDDLVVPYVLKKGVHPGTTPDGNKRLDATFYLFSNHTAYYNSLTGDLFILFCEYDSKPDFSNFSTCNWNDTDVIFTGEVLDNVSLLTISNCGEILNLDNHLSNIYNTSNTGNLGIFYEFDFINSNTDFRSMFSSINLSQNQRITEALGLGTYITIKNTKANVLAQMREGLEFTVIYACASEPKNSLEIATLICLDSDAYHKIGNNSNILTQVNVIPVDGSDTPIYDYKGQLGNVKLFNVNATCVSHANVYYLIIKFTKTPSNWESANLLDYYLFGLILNGENSNGVKETILFNYSRFNDLELPDEIIVGQTTSYGWTNNCLTTGSGASCTGLDTAALYSINFYAIKDPDTTEILLEITSGSGAFLPTSCCIVDPLTPDVNYTWLTRPITLTYSKLAEKFEEVGLCYTRSAESFVFGKTDDPLVSSFIADTNLKYLGHYYPGSSSLEPPYYPQEECYILFPIEYTGAQLTKEDLADIIKHVIEESGGSVDSQTIVNASYAVGVSAHISTPSGFVAVPESLFFEEHVPSADIDIKVSEYPRAVTVRNIYFGKIMQIIYDTYGYNEFYIYYKTHFYHYAIDTSLFL